MWKFVGALLLAFVWAAAVPADAASRTRAGAVEGGSCNCVGGNGWCHVEGLSPMICTAGKYPDGSDPCTGTCQIVPPANAIGGNTIILKGKTGGDTFTTVPPMEGNQ